MIGIAINVRSNIKNSQPQEAQIICIPMVQPSSVLAIPPTSMQGCNNLPIAISLEVNHNNFGQHDSEHQYITVPIESVLAEIL